MSGTLVVVGDTLLDRDLSGSVTRLCPDAPVPVVEDLTERARPGGAGLAALLAARDGHHVVLVTALAADPAGDRLRILLERAGITVVSTECGGETTQKVRVRGAGQVLLRLDYGTQPGEIGACTAAMRRAISQAGAVLVADYGRGVAAAEPIRSALATAGGPVVWDPHPRGPAPVAGIRLATPNLAEARAVAPPASADPRLHVAAEPWASCAEQVRARWDVAAVAVTLGADGAVLARAGSAPLHVPAQPVDGDTCGAGDRFASAAAGALLAGATLPRAVAAAVAAATAYVAAGGPASLDVPEDVFEPMEVR
ncbi:MAG: rfaE2 [Actinomycetia bacterium]|jgi:rfaE bifunctional protein kinase chain/domain|nr:rfaE2 [Actinomycetes bacterium]MDQ1651641.1 D-beta-D-heptose 7-phosphate kinase / D-beta-D-heptose 1-phosphate adenosyltransferase [Cryptosporangiaceae bacterium]